MRVGKNGRKGVCMRRRAWLLNALLSVVLGSMAQGANAQGASDLDQMVDQMTQPTPTAGSEGGTGTEAAPAAEGSTRDITAPDTTSAGTATGAVAGGEAGGGVAPPPGGRSVSHGGREYFLPAPRERIVL